MNDKNCKKCNRRFIFTDDNEEELIEEYLLHERKCKGKLCHMCNNHFMAFENFGDIHCDDCNNIRLTKMSEKNKDPCLICKVM